MFQPKGEKPLWQLVYEYIEELPVDTVITLGDLSKVIDGDIEKNRGAVYKAMRTLAKNEKRYLESVRGRGYKVIEGPKQLDIAESRHERADRQLKMANFEALNINTKVMSLEERSRWSQFMAWNGQALAVLSHNAQEIAKAGIVTGMVSDVIADKVSAIERQLEEMRRVQEKLAV